MPSADAASPPAQHDHLLRDILLDDAVTASYQPIVHLGTGEVVGYEALARGPLGTPLASPGALFAAARAAGQELEMEWACRKAALRGALDAELSGGRTLFVNVELTHLAAAVPDDLDDLQRDALDRMPVVLEFSERELQGDPAPLLRTLHEARSDGWGLAMDNVGVEPAALSIHGLVRPDVLKLDRGIVQGEVADAVRGRVLNAVANTSQLTGCTVVAEGLETAQDIAWARSMGAVLGQGWELGRPRRLPDAAEVERTSETVALLRTDPAPHARTPFQLIEHAGALRRAAKEDLLVIARDIEHVATTTHVPPAVLTTVDRAEGATPSMLGRYAEIASRSALVVALGPGMVPRPAPGVFGGDLDADDPLADEWTLVVLGAHTAVALIARDVGDDGPDAQRRFDYLVTHDRGAVRAAAEILARHVSVEAQEPHQGDTDATGST